MNPDLNIAEIPYDGGEIQFRYSRYMSPDGSRWIRHGVFLAYHKNGGLASGGNYIDGLEEGSWRDYYENGKLAALGKYERGIEVGEWCYWDENGSPRHDL